MRLAGEPWLERQVTLVYFTGKSAVAQSQNEDLTVVEPDNVQPQPPQGRGDHPTLTSDTARQGPPGYRVLLVLAMSVVGAAFILGGIYIFYFHS